MQLFLRYLRTYKKLVIWAVILMVVNQVFSLLDPQFFRFIIDHYASRAGELILRDYMVGIGILIGGYIATAFISRVAKNFQDYFTNKVALSVETDMYRDSIDHALALPYARFEDEYSGALLDKIKRAAQNARELISVAIGGFFYLIIGLLFVVSYGFWVHSMIGLFYLLSVPIIAISTFRIGRKIKSIQRSIVLHSNELAGNTTETVRNIGLVKSLGLELQEIGRLQDTNREILDLELKKQKSIRYLSFAQGTIINFLRAMVILVSAYFVWKGEVSVGEMFSLFIYSFYLFNPLQELGTMATKYYEAKASLAVLHEFLEEPKEPSIGTTTIETVREITFDKVSFGYKTRSEDALANISATIRAGETVAFVGPSGAGKSTVIKLLTGLYKPTTGGISVNGIPSDELSYASLRSKVGLVMQENDLFAGTVAYNIRFVKKDATDAEISKALAQAEATSIIDAPGRAGIETIIGEGGVKLSGGERQRIAIARALIRKPDVLIFDEATSALDSITEKKIVDTIRGLRTHLPEQIMILIAHRLSTVMHADRIYVLEKGKVVESGTHTDLLNQGGLYHALWREQGNTAQ